MFVRQEHRGGGEAGVATQLLRTLEEHARRHGINELFLGTTDAFTAYLKDSLDFLREEGRTTPRMMSVGLHCRLVGRPGRAAALARFLDHVVACPDVWVCTRAEIARHWWKEHPPA